jgi:hypothetical protein
MTDVRQVGLVEFMSTFRPAGSPQPSVVHSVEPFVAAEQSASYQYPMVQQCYSVDPPSSNGSMTYSPMMPV